MTEVTLGRYMLEEIESSLWIPSQKAILAMAKELLELKYRRLPYEPKNGPLIPPVQRLTAEQINSLPEFAREWIHDLETQTDRTGQLAELRLLQDAFKAQEILIAELRAKQ